MRKSTTGCFSLVTLSTRKILSFTDSEVQVAISKRASLYPLRISILIWHRLSFNQRSCLQSILKKQCGKILIEVLIRHAYLLAWPCLAYVFGDCDENPKTLWLAGLQSGSA